MSQENQRSGLGSKRTGAQTRAEIVRVALDLFTEQGYEATSLRQIAEVLGVQKASLYYHFASKDEIVRAGFARRGSEAIELLDWVREQPDSPDLLRRTVLRWIDTYSGDKLKGIRFINANPTLVRAGAVHLGAEIADPLETIVALVDHSTAADDRVLVRMAFLSINAAAASAAAGTPDDDIIAAARRSALAILDALENRGSDLRAEA